MTLYHDVILKPRIGTNMMESESDKKDYNDEGRDDLDDNGDV